MTRAEIYSWLVSEPKPTGKYWFTFKAPKESSNLSELTITTEGHIVEEMVTDYIVTEDERFIRVTGTIGSKELKIKDAPKWGIQFLGNYLKIPVGVFQELLDAQQFEVVETIP